MDSLELPHRLILAGTLLVIAGVIARLIDRKKLGRVDEVPANEASSEAAAPIAPATRPSRLPAAKRTASGRGRWRPGDEGEARMTEPTISNGSAEASA